MKVTRPLSIYTNAVKQMQDDFRCGRYQFHGDYAFGDILHTDELVC